ncbi:hypothetical protein V7021_20130 [Cytobacillus firmus]
MDEQGNDHDNKVKIAIYKAAPILWSGWFNLLKMAIPWFLSRSVELLPLSGDMSGKCPISNPQHSMA